jgi:arylsulfatase A-like enzyme
MGRVLILVPLALAACGPAAEPLTIDGQVDRLLARFATAEVLEAVPGHPPHIAALAPRVDVSVNAGVLPSLVLPPPATVAFDLAPGPPGTWLDLASGLDGTAYGEGAAQVRVRLRATLDGLVVFDEVHPSGPGVPSAQRSWRPSWLDVSAGGRLELSSTLVEPDGNSSDRPIACGFGNLRRVVPREVQPVSSSPEAPNVILVVVDTLRADHLGCYGDRRAVTPALDRMARSGTRFARGYAPSSWTWPSTASLLTGVSPVAHGMLDAQHCFLSDEFTTLAESMQRAGAVTGAFSANPVVAPGKNFEQGFATWRQWEWAPARELWSEVEAWIGDRGDGRFFLYVHLVDPHTPYTSRPDARARFGATERQVDSATLVSWVDARARGAPHPRAQLADEVERMRRLYRSEVFETDRFVEGLLRALERRGLAGRTVLVVTSDHGEEFLEHDLIGHGNQLHDETVHVPLILTGPGVPVGKVVDGPVELARLAPTLLELAGVPIPNGVRGPSLLRDPDDATVFFVLHDGDWVERSPTGVEAAPELYAVQHGSLRLHWRPPTGSRPARTALFDLSGDPGARRDLSRERPEQVADLIRRIERWRDGELARRPALLPGGTAAGRQLEQMGYTGDGAGLTEGR